ncbi:MAG: 6-phosphogluconolactonase [Phycisphaerales bacterium]
MTVPYSVEPEPRKPALPGSVVVCPTTEDLIDTVARDIAAHSIDCVRRFGDFHIALSGGSTPFPLYRHLMIDPDCRAIPWTRTHLWIVDERCVPFDHEKSNWRQIDEILVQHSGIPPEQAHPMMVMQDDAAEAYDRTLHETLEWREKGHDRLDFVILGMGDDGHTASLFPHSPALEDAGRWVLKNTGPRVTPPDRVTMTYTLLNAARFIAVLCTGTKKQEMIAKVAAGRHSPAELPIQGIKPMRGELRWYLDAAACP